MWFQNVRVVLKLNRGPIRYEVYLGTFTVNIRKYCLKTSVFPLLS